MCYKTVLKNIYESIVLSEYEIFNNKEQQPQCEVCYRFEECQLLDILLIQFNGKSMWDILSYFLSIKDYRLIENSFYLCLTCLKQLILSFLFLEKLEKSNQRFKGLVKFSSKDDNTTKNNQVVTNHNDRNSFLTSIVNKDHSIKNDASDQESEHFIDANLEMDKNNEEDNDANSSKEDFPPTNDADNQLTCEHCFKTFKLKTQLDRHIIRVHKSLSHKKDCKGKEECSVCGKKFNKYSLKSHMERHSTIKKYKCVFCEKDFFQELSLNRHMILHQEPKFGCEYCGKAFFTKAEMLTHIRRHHTREIVCSCQVCGKGFVHKSNLTQHMKNCHPNETGEKYVEPKVPKQCNICGKIYSSRTSLAHHKRRAHENQTYPCTKCKLSFRNLNPLKSHLKRIHDIGETYTCNICQKHCVTTEELSKHKKVVHQVRGKSLYLCCTICKIKFKTKHELVQHMQCDHFNLGNAMETPVLYECSICLTFFFDIETLKAHVGDLHSDKIKEELATVNYEIGGCKIISVKK